MEKELTTSEAFEGLQKLVYNGVPFQGSLVEIDQKKQAVEKLFEVLGNALDLEQKQNGE